MVQPSWPRTAVVVGVVEAVVVAVVNEHSSNAPSAKASRAPFNAFEMLASQVIKPSMTADRSPGSSGAAPNVNWRTMFARPSTAWGSDATRVFTRIMERPVVGMVWHMSTPGSPPLPDNACSFISISNDFASDSASSHLPDECHGLTLHSQSSRFNLVTCASQWAVPAIPT